MLPLISIIIPVYNVEKYIANCLNSIVNQTYKNLEIIIINDGSTDLSIEIAFEFQKNDNRIFIFNKENGGVASARNYGLDSANGEFIGFVDPDDFVDVRMYEVLYNNLVNAEADISACYVRGCKDMNYVEPPQTDILIEEFNHIESLDQFLSSKYSFNGNNTNLINKLYKKALFQNLRFNEQLHIGEDIDMIFKLFFRSEKLVFSTERLYFNYHREGSLTKTVKSFEIQERVELGLINMYAERLRMISDEKKYKNLKIKTINDLLTYNIEVYYKNRTGNQKILRKMFLNNFKKHFFYSVKNFSFKRIIRLFLFLFSPYLYIRIFKIEIPENRTII